MVNQELEKEAIKRLKLMKVHNNVIKDLKEDNRINRSEGNMGLLYWISEEEQELINNFEKEKGVFVYHIIKTYTRDMETIYDLLYITNYKENWDIEREDIKNGYVLAYTISPYPETGNILVDYKNGGIVRKY